VKQEQFLEVVPVAEARERWHRALVLRPLPAEDVDLAHALGRTLAADVLAPGDVPAFDRSNVDGFAVRAADTFGASERVPRRLTLLGGGAGGGGAGRPVAGPVGADEAAAIATGAALPRGADAVVMVEETEPGPDGTVLVSRAVVPGGRVSHAGSDVSRGETVLRAGTPLTARDTGTLAACGLARVACVRRPRVAILSTGDEIVPPGRPLAPGQVHDANAALLADAVKELGGEAVALGVARDDEADLRARLTEAASGFDAVLLSGGTSKGGGDLSTRVLREFATVAVHGVALKPGKPLCLAAKDGRPWAVLPGFPSSAAFTFHTFVAPVLLRLLGRAAATPGSVRARLPRHLASEPGRLEFTLVSLLRARQGLLAFPLGKGSGSVAAFARADGFLAVEADTEYVEAGQEVEVTLLSRHLAPVDLVVVGSHCVGLERVLSRLARAGTTSKTIWVGSQGGVEAAREGACDAAPLHLYDPDARAWNAPFAPPATRLLAGYGRRQGIAYRPADPGPLAAGDPEAALLAALADPRLVLANRNPGSGTRALLDLLLRTSRREGTVPPGWAAAYRSHTAVASAVAQRRADYGVCLESAARAAGLAWRPWREERYDFLVPEERWDRPGVAALRAALADEEVRALLRAEGLSP
jgi:putative molybdopterin biosynthesis protein